MKKFAIFMLIGLLSGCVYMGKNFDESKLVNITKGETTKEQIFNIFGEPSSVSYDSDGNQILQWTYSEGNALGQGKAKILNIKMHDGKVESYSVSKSAI